MQTVSNWPNDIVSTAPFSLTGSTGEYLRIVGSDSDG